MTNVKRLTRDQLENQLLRALEHMPAAFYMIDRQWNFSYLNQTAARTLQRTRHELIGRNVWEAFPEASDTAIYPNYLQAMDCDEPCHFEIHYPALEGWFEINAYPSEDGLAVYFRPISAGTEAPGQITRGTAHDFNSLFTGILGDAGRLTDALHQQPDLQPLAKLIASAANQGADLSRHLLTSDRDQALTRTAGPPQPAPVTEGRVSILLAEDDPMVRSFVAKQLQSAGYQVVETASGPEALARLTEHQDIDLLFTDVMMPGGMTGPQLASAARQLRPGLPVLFTSGYTENAMGENGLLPADVYLLHKPYRKADLLRMIKEVLDGAH